MPQPIQIHMVVRDYDIIGPIAKGDVAAERIDLTLDRTAPIAAFRSGDTFQAGEMSMSKYLIGLSEGDRSVVGLPVFPMRAFRHRCFFVRRDSGLTSFKQLERKRVGTNGWFDTGNTWSRAAMRRDGVDLSSIGWWVGTTDQTTEAAFGHQAAVVVPEGINAVPSGSTLQDMLVKDRRQCCPYCRHASTRRTAPSCVCSRTIPRSNGVTTSSSATIRRITSLDCAEMCLNGIRRSRCASSTSSNARACNRSGHAWR